MDNLIAADVPKVLDLVEEGFARQRFEDLFSAYKDPTLFWLKASFSFNVKQGFLGICVRHKETVGYAFGNIDGPQGRAN